MVEDLGFSEAVYGFGAGIFFLGYLLFEMPSNLFLVSPVTAFYILHFRRLPISPSPAA
jgi:hypothetical protein